MEIVALNTSVALLPITAHLLRDVSLNMESATQTSPPLHHRAQLVLLQCTSYPKMLDAERASANKLVKVVALEIDAVRLSG